MTFTIYSPEFSRLLAKQPYRFLLAVLGGAVGAAALANLALLFVAALGAPVWFTKVIIVFGAPVFWLALAVAINKFLLDLAAQPSDRTGDT